MRRFLPFLLLAILLVGVGFGVDLGLSEAPSGSHLGLAMPSVHPAPVSTGSSTTSTTSLVVAAPKPGDPGWPITVYEPAVPSKGGALAQCPNPLGLESFGPSQESAAQQIATSYDHISLNTDLHNSDPSSWIAVERMWQDGPGHGLTNPYVVGARSGLSGPSRYIVPYACGATIGGETYSVIVGPSPNPDCVACRTTISFVDRAGQPLIYFVY